MNSSILYLKRFLCAVFVALIVLGSPISMAGVVSFTNTESAIAADGIIDWSVIGPPTTVIADPAFTIDIQGTPFVATVSEPPLPPLGYNPRFNSRPESDGFTILQQGVPFPNGFVGYFATGEPLLFTGLDGYNNLGFEFSSPVRGFGLQVHSFAFDRTDGFVAVFDTEGNLLNTFDFTAKPIKRAPNPFFDGQTGDGSATFIGVRSTEREIGAVLFNYLTNDIPDLIGYNSFVVSNARVEVAFEGPTGLTPNDALMPSSETPNAEGGWEFNNVLGTGRWFDPPATSGYVYATTDGVSKFTMVTIPGITGDADGKFYINDLINPLVEVLADVPFVFPVPVDTFELTGIDPTVDGGDPLAFPTFLVFDQVTVSFTQTPLGVSIPEPSSLVLVGVLAVLVKSTRRRRRING